MTDKIKCTECGGEGFYTVMGGSRRVDCGACGGTGEVEAKPKVKQPRKPKRS